MCEHCVEKGARRASPAPTRRGFLLLGLGLLAGCANQKIVTSMPSPPWPPPGDGPAGGGGAGTVTPPPAPAPVTPAWRARVLGRDTWAGGAPVPARMNRMTPVRYITIHHDGMDPFFATDVESVAGHLEAIRRLHRRKGWGDIGYHFAIDRAGRVWEARPLGYQGAHVKDHNPGNVGIVVLGNFEEQTPSGPQMEAVRRHVTSLMRGFNVPLSRVQTHQEWGAHTACPGSTLQLYLEQLRLSGRLG